MLKAARNMRAGRAGRTIRRAVEKHLKVEARVSPLLNETLWEHGRQRPPGQIRVKVRIQDDVGRVSLPEEIEQVTSAPKGKLKQLKDKIAPETKEQPALATGKAAEPEDKAAAVPPNKAARETNVHT